MTANIPEGFQTVTTIIVLTDELPFAAAGATVTMACRDMFYGDRIGALEDPFGYVWAVATHIEDVSPAEYETRMKAWAASL